jgi:hypothetical protein
MSIGYRSFGKQGIFSPTNKCVQAFPQFQIRVMLNVKSGIITNYFQVNDGKNFMENFIKSC